MKLDAICTDADGQLFVSYLPFGLRPESADRVSTSFALAEVL